MAGAVLGAALLAREARAAGSAGSGAPLAGVDATGAAAAGAVAPENGAGAPLELDVQFQGETHAVRRPGARSLHLDGLVLLSAADGVGLGGQLRAGVLGVRGTLAYQPLLFLVDADPGDKKFGSYEFSNSLQLNVDALLVTSDSETGGSIGYRYNDVLGHGFTVAYQSTFEMWGQHFSLALPVTYYPKATERVRDQFGIDPDYEINFPFGAGLQFGLGAAWVL